MFEKFYPLFNDRLPNIMGEMSYIIFLLIATHKLFYALKLTLACEPKVAQISNMCCRPETDSDN